MGTSNSRRGGILFGLSLAGLLILCLAAAAGLFFVREITVRNGVSIDTPAGSLDIHPRDKFDTSITGVPAYPGAKSRNGGGAVVEWSSHDGKGDKGLAVAEFVTTDPVDQVVEYYRHKLPDWRMQRKDAAVEMEMDEGGAKRVIGIERKSDGTHIGVATAGEPASN